MGRQIHILMKFKQIRILIGEKININKKKHSTKKQIVGYVEITDNYLFNLYYY